MIRFDCLTCGKKLTVPDDRAGKLGKCPGCKETFRIPGGEDDEVPEELETVEDEPPRSGRDLAGRRARYPEEDRPREDDSDRRLKSLVKKPRRKRRRADAGPLSFLTDIDPLIWILVGGVLMCLATVCAGVINRDLAALPMLLGAMVGFIGQMWVLLKAFQDDVMHGLGCLFIPCYIFYYILTHFDEVRYPACCCIAGYVVVGVAMCFVEPDRGAMPRGIYRRGEAPANKVSWKLC